MGALTGISGNSGNSGLMSSYIPAAPQAEVTTYIANVVLAGGTVTKRQPLDDLIAIVKASGALALIQKWFFPTGPDTFTGILVPLIDTTATGNFVNTNFISGDLNSFGLQGVDGENTRLNSLYVPSTHLVSVDSCCVGLHVQYEDFTNRQFDYPRTFGSKSSDSAWCALEQNYTSYYSAKFFSNAQSAGSGSSQLNSGNVFINRTSSTSLSVINNGVTVATNTDAHTGTAPTVPIFLFCENNGGTPGDYSYSRLLSWFIGSSMTTAQMSSIASGIALYKSLKGI